MTPARVIDTQRLATLANAYERDIVHFLRELAIPALTWRIRLEMEKVGFAEIRVDPLGNILGRIGSGANVIVVASQADIPGAAGMASAIYAGKLIDELGMYDDFTLWVAGCGQAGFHGEGIRPHCVLLTEPTNLRITRGTIPGAEDPTAVLGESHPLVEAAIATYETLFELPPLVGKRSSNAPAGVPTVAFGPGEEETVGNLERVPVRHLVKAAQFYAAFPSVYVDTAKRR